MPRSGMPGSTLGSALRGVGDSMTGTGAAWLLEALDRAVAETTLFAAVLFLIGGIDDLLVDLHWLVRLRGRRAVPLADLPPSPAMRLAVFVPAWDEHRVIAAMLDTALGRWRDPDLRIYVGCYPNDPATIRAVADVAARDSRVRLVIGTRAGPTTKADCLNTLWGALLRADAAEARHTEAVVLHDAEDVVDAAELRVHAHFLRDAALVQLPVVPLVDPRRRWVSGHYADEFAHSHGVELVVRSAIGAALPLAGVGCAVRRDALDRLAGAGMPFAADSLTEDYELGLRVAAMGLPARFARVRGADGAMVATRAYFPDTVAASVRQKARWVAGIALAGWDRTGWGGRLRPAELWMRMRDRRAPLAVLVLVAGYLALLGWGASALAHALAGTRAPAPGPGVATVLSVNAALLCWRLLARIAATTGAHGWREGAWAAPRMIVGNFIAMLAARHALARYLRMLAGRGLRWEKTAHRFPGAA